VVSRLRTVTSPHACWFIENFQLSLACTTKEVKEYAAYEFISHGDRASGAKPMYRVSIGVRSTQNQDGTMVLDIQRGRILRLNVTGSMIFERLQQGQTESQIIDGISQEFRISHEIARTDVCEFLKSMEQVGLVHDDTGEVRL